jgi:hypothetical protein
MSAVCCTISIQSALCQLYIAQLAFSQPYVSCILHNVLKYCSAIETELLTQQHSTIQTELLTQQHSAIETELLTQQHSAIQTELLTQQHSAMTKNT